jgi:cell cycle sensor histidine kinase DivJ
MGFADIMRQRLFGPIPDRYADYPELIHESGGHLLELINDVLDISKIEAERYELYREDFDAREAVNAVLRLMRGQADRAEVALRGLLPLDPIEVSADRRALKQITLNLLSNALKFTPKAGVVTVTLRADGPVMELIVADTGPGISAADLKKLRLAYEQAGDNDHRVGGTGLGLSLVKAFAQLHGGEMVLESQLGEGTTVTVRMPVVHSQAARASVELFGQGQADLPAPALNRRNWAAKAR